MDAPTQHPGGGRTVADALLFCVCCRAMACERQRMIAFPTGVGLCIECLHACVEFVVADERANDARTTPTTPPSQPR